MPIYIAYDRETLEIKRRYEYTHALDRGEGYVHVEIQPEMFSEAVIIKRGANNEIIITQDAEIREKCFSNYMKTLRQERNKRLTECDWVVIRATSTDTPIPEEWKVYMQTLRDLPSTTEDPANPVWPTAPTS